MTKYLSLFTVPVVVLSCSLAFATNSMCSKRQKVQLRAKAYTSEQIRAYCQEFETILEAFVGDQGSDIVDGVIVDMKKAGCEKVTTLDGAEGNRTVVSSNCLVFSKDSGDKCEKLKENFALVNKVIVPGSAYVVCFGSNNSIPAAKPTKKVIKRTQ